MSNISREGYEHSFGELISPFNLTYTLRKFPYLYFCPRFPRAPNPAYTYYFLILLWGLVLVDEVITC